MRYEVLQELLTWGKNEQLLALIFIRLLLPWPWSLEATGCFMVNCLMEIVVCILDRYKQSGGCSAQRFYQQTPEMICSTEVRKEVMPRILDNLKFPWMLKGSRIRGSIAGVVTGSELGEKAKGQHAFISDLLEASEFKKIVSVAFSHWSS